MKDKIIVLGKGFLGTKFEMKGFEVLGKDKFDFKREKNEEEQLLKLDEYDVVINCIAKTNTRWCEKKENFSESLFSNGIIPGILSKYCKNKGKKFVHISTGCLYDKPNAPNKETDFIAAHCNYTLTKWIGEIGCNSDDLILRPRLLFSDFQDKNNLLWKLPNFNRFLTELDSRTSLDVIVDATEKLLKNEQSGIFNVACDGYATTKEIAELIGLSGEGMTIDELRKKDNLYLVVNIMDISKLKQFYQPPKLENEVIRCWKRLNP